jgi:hypothetical protein
MRWIVSHWTTTAASAGIGASTSATSLDHEVMPELPGCPQQMRREVREFAWRWGNPLASICPNPDLDLPGVDKLKVVRSDRRFAPHWDGLSPTMGLSSRVMDAHHHRRSPRSSLRSQAQTALLQLWLTP